MGRGGGGSWWRWTWRRRRRRECWWAVVTSLWRRACSKYSKLRGSGKSRGCKTEQTRADQSRGCRTEQTRAEHSLLNSAKQSSASTHDQGPWQYQTPAPGSGTGTLALALASAGRQCIPSRWTRVPVSERATTRIMAAAGHGNANANANGDCDARSTGATGRRLVPLRLSTYLPQPPSTVNLSQCLLSSSHPLLDPHCRCFCDRPSRRGFPGAAALMVVCSENQHLNTAKEYWREAISP